MKNIKIDDVEYLEKVNETAVEYKDQEKLDSIKAAKKSIEDKLGPISELKMAAKNETELNHLHNTKHKIEGLISACKEEIDLLELIQRNIIDDIDIIETNRSELLQKLDNKNDEEEENDLHPTLKIDKAYRTEKQNQLINSGKVGHIKRAI
jgi:peroxiredoxin family protein